jgi:hypothetical protein
MTDRTHDDPPAPADRTRDIMLPPLPDRAPPALPKAWAGLSSPSRLDSPTTAVDGPVAPPAPPAAQAPQIEEVEQVEEVDPAVEKARRLAKSRTDEILPPPAPVVRQRTLAFSSPEMRHRPIEPVRVEPRPRRWPWVVLTLLPILVILASAIGWLILLRGS